MNVLSLFDGISCGRIALDRAGVKVDAYVASEVDRHALNISRGNYEDITYVGDVTALNYGSLPSIDLLMGGSPCQGFSFAGKRLNFEDKRSALFFHFVNALDFLKPRYFLLENVKMKKSYQEVITSYLGVEPVMIDSALFSKQSRKRLYWTNIPYTEPVDRNLLYNQYLYRLPHGYVKEELRLYEKYPTLTAQSPGSKHRLVLDVARAMSASSQQLRRDSTLTRVLTPVECEELQTLPVGYTNVGNTSKTQRYKAIGNGWTVDVIAHIIKGI